MTSLLALPLAFFLAEFLLSHFNTLIHKHLNFLFFYQFPNMFYVFGSAILIGVVAGLYPALFLSKFNPIDTLRDIQLKSQKGRLFRNSLIIFQFAVSIILLVSIITVYEQTSFLNKKDLGFDDSQLLHISLPIDGPSKGSILKENLLKNPLIESASLSRGTPGTSTSSYSGILNKNEERKECAHFGIDSNFMKTFGFQLVAGRNLKEFESSGCLINEAYARFME